MHKCFKRSVVRHAHFAILAMFYNKATALLGYAEEQTQELCIAAMFLSHNTKLFAIIVSSIA